MTCNYTLVQAARGGRLLNSSLTGPIFSRALNSLMQLGIFSARDKDWPVNERNRLVSLIAYQPLESLAVLPVSVDGLDRERFNGAHVSIPDS
jgi:hypothetical protein